MANLKCNPDGTFPAPKPRKVKKDELDLKTCVLDKKSGRWFSTDLLALNIEYKIMDEIKILKVLFENKEILVDLSSETEIIKLYDDLDEILDNMPTVTMRGQDHDRIILPMVARCYGYTADLMNDIARAQQ
jgi:hypothetical protein